MDDIIGKTHQSYIKENVHFILLLPNNRTQVNRLLEEALLDYDTLANNDETWPYLKL